MLGWVWASAGGCGLVRASALHSPAFQDLPEATVDAPRFGKPTRTRATSKTCCLMVVARGSAGVPGHLLAVRVYRFLAEASPGPKPKPDGPITPDSRSAGPVALARARSEFGPEMDFPSFWPSSRRLQAIQTHFRTSQSHLEAPQRQRRYLQTERFYC